MDFLRKISVVFLNSPYRETSKNILTKKTRKESRVVVEWVSDLANARGGGAGGGPSICFFAGPLLTVISTEE
jgi:hypothetical protein